MRSSLLQNTCNKKSRTFVDIPESPQSIGFNGKNEGNKTNLVRYHMQAICNWNFEGLSRPSTPEDLWAASASALKETWLAPRTFGTSQAKAAAM